MEKRLLGSLYFSKHAVPPGAKYSEEELSIGNTISGKELAFVEWNDLLVADRAVCTNISWEQLDSMGFIFGQPIKIDGQSYLCRSLRIGNQKDVPNEWDSTLDEVGDADDIWHWRDVCFWGQDKLFGSSFYHAVRGCDSPRCWLSYPASHRLASVGFRPALEPLPPEPLISDNLAGSVIKVYGPAGSSISGVLLEITDYDLVIGNSQKEVPQFNWCRRKSENQVIIDRASITYFTKT